MADMLDMRTAALHLLHAVNENQAKRRTHVTVMPHVEAQKMGWGTGPYYEAVLTYLLDEGALVEDPAAPRIASNVPAAFMLTTHGLWFLREEGYL